MFRLIRSVGHRPFVRRFGTTPSEPSTLISPTEIPLNKPLPGFPTPIFATVNEELQNETQITTLPSGLRVASSRKFGQFCTTGLVIDSGSRYEVSYPSGISHFLEKLAFGSTKSYSGRDEIMQLMEKHGGICDSQITRDSAVYAASCITEKLDGVIKLLNEVSRQMLISPSEMESVRQAIRFDLEELNFRIEQEPILTEMIHTAAYRDNTLGLPRMCPGLNSEKITEKTLFSFLSRHYAPSRMVVAGVGMEHAALVESVDKHFSNTKATWEEDPTVMDAGLARVAVDDSLAQYTGGDVRVTKDLSNISHGLQPIPNMAHFVLGFESCSHQDPDFIAVCVLNILLGGGGSFSAGGPGKGMYSRLYMNVLNRNDFIYNATAYNHAYTDSGLFCVHGAAPPDKAKELCEIIIAEMKASAGPVGKTELNRAKTALSSVLMMNLESRPIIFEDIGRQVLAYGHRKSAKSLVEEINNVSAEDIQRVATKMLRSRASVAVLGDLTHFPSHEEIEAELAAAPLKKSSKRFSVFS